MNFYSLGLQAGWFDACVGYPATADREALFDFTVPYVDTVSTFTVLNGNPYGFNPDLTDLSSFTIGK